MKFVVNNSQYPEIKDTFENESTIFLETDNWDDYSYKTFFSIKVIEKGFWKEIGTLRILNYESLVTKTVIPREFNSLSDEFVSLGTNKEFYEELIDNFGKSKAEKILLNLNDISIKNIDDNPHFTIEHTGIQNSLFRSSDARYLYEEVSNIYFKEIKSSDRDYEFTFNFKVDDDEYIPIVFDFSKHDYLPNRFFALIGKNGVGKTRLLNQLSKSLYDSSNPSNRNRFIIENNYEIPIYQKVIAISFSVFDKFFKGESKSSNEKEQTNIVETKKANYTYIGLHKVDNTVLTAKEISNINSTIFKKLLFKERAKRFVELLNKSKILHEDVEFEDINDSFFTAHFSSGQKIFISMLCRLLAEIEDGSLIFFDEPELYLHPNAIASLMNIFNDILNEYQSYAILCTHSPILVQEIPSRYVRNLSLIEGSLIQTEVTIETFGANISDITKDVYNVSEHESLYKTTFKELAKELDEEEIEKLFQDRLSLKARMFLSSLYLGDD